MAFKVPDPGDLAASAVRRDLPSDFGRPELSVPDTGLRLRPSRFTSDKDYTMARRRTGMKGGRGKTTIRTGFTPTFPLKGSAPRMARRRSNKGRH